MSKENTEDLPEVSVSGETIYYIVMDDEGIWMMQQTPDKHDEILFQTTDKLEAERALCIELARCD